MAKEGIKLCKYCKAEMAAAASICPNCKKKQNGFVKWIIIAVVVLGIIGIATGSGSDDDSKPKKTGEVTTEGEQNNNNEEQNNNNGIRR